VWRLIVYIVESKDGPSRTKKKRAEVLRYNGSGFRKREW
jgi:hypothetical protein